MTISINYYTSIIADPANNAWTMVLNYSNEGFTNAIGGTAIQIFIGPLDIPNHVFPTLTDASNYMFTTYSPAMTAAVNAAYSSSDYVTGSLVTYVEPYQTGFNSKADAAALTATSSAFTPTLVTSTSGGGTQISATKRSEVSASVYIDTSVSLSGNSKGYVVCEIATSNSTTAGDWKEVSRISSGQSGSLVVGLVLNQTGGAPLGGKLNAGDYVRYRSVNQNGTPTYTVTAGQKTIYG